MTTTSYGTRWGRTAGLTTLALATVAAVLLGMRNDVLAAPGVIYQGEPAKFSSGRVSGENVAFGMSEMTARNTDGTTETVTVLSAGFATGTLDGFCLSQVERIAPFGEVVIRITAGDGDPTTMETVAANVQFDVTELRGNGTGVNLDGMVHLGLAASDVTTLPGVDNPLGAPTGPGYFGIDAAKGDLFAVKGRLHNAEIGGPMNLRNLSIQVGPHVEECWTDDTRTDDLPH